MSLLYALLSLSSCRNLPERTAQKAERKNQFLWEILPTESDGTPILLDINETKRKLEPTPQLVRAVDFERAFSENGQVSPVLTADNKGKQDSAVWKYFYPAEYTQEMDENLKVAFTNSGESIWGNSYRLEFYAGENPSTKDSVFLSRSVHPNEEAVFEIPLKNSDPNWTSCWRLLNDREVQLYEFCYNHGDPNAAREKNAPSAPSPSTGGTNSEGVFYAFVKTTGAAPEKESNEAFQASEVSLEPGNDHTFCAYDHSETLKATFTNTGTEAWTEAVSLNFYSGYNWMHTNTYSVNGSVAPGESCTFYMPMEIFEDNDNWNTCWYLASPNGKTMSEFCFKYHTRGC